MSYRSVIDFKYKITTHINANLLFHRFTFCSLESRKLYALVSIMTIYFGSHLLNFTYYNLRPFMIYTWNFSFSYWLRISKKTESKYSTPMIFLLQIASVFTNAIRDYRYLLLEPKIADISYRVEYDIVMRKWYILSSLKMIKVILQVHQYKDISYDTRNESKKEFFFSECEY